MSLSPAAESALPQPVVVGQETNGAFVQHAEESERETQGLKSRQDKVHDVDQVPVDGLQIPAARSNPDSTGDIGDPSGRGFPYVDEAIATLREAVRQTSNDHPDRLRHLEHLGLALESRFGFLRDIHDLEEAISSYREATQLAPDSHPHRARYLANLGDALWARFDFLGNVRDLDEAATSCEEAVQLTPHDHLKYASRLTSLGSILWQRFDRLGDTSDLERSIARLKEAVELTPCDHLDRAERLDTLGTSLGTCFVRLGDIHYIDQAILRQEEAVELTTLGDPTRPRRLVNLGISLRVRFSQLGRLDDIEQAIVRGEEAAQLAPGDHLGRAGALANLGISYGDRFNRLGNLADLEQSIARLEEAVNLTPHNDCYRPARLINLGVSLRSRFVRLGNVSDLDQSTARAEEAARLIPVNHLERVDALASLGVSFVMRFARFDDIRDLERAIARQEEAVHLLPHNHPERARHLVNLGISLQCRFSHLYDMSTLEEAIAMKEEALQLTPHNHPHRAYRLATLGDSLGTRFLFFDNASDLDRAISMAKEAVELTPHDHPDLALHLFDLGSCLRLRFDRFGDLGDLEQEIVAKEKAIQLTPCDKPDYAICIASLAISLQNRFIRLGDTNDLEQAIRMQEEVLQLTPHDYPSRAYRLENLGNFLRIRFCRFGDIGDLDHAIAKQKEAMQLTPDDHISRANRLHTLAVCLQDRHDALRDKSALNEALINFSSAARASTASSSLRFSAAEGWISCARSLGHDSLLDAYAVAIEVLPQLAWIGFTIATRYQALCRGASIVREAASAALELGHPDTAVEWLEHGRFIVWNDILQLRSPLDELRAKHPTLADKLCQVSSTLERTSARDQPFSSSSGAEMTDRPRSLLEEQARQHRLLAMKRDELLKDVRALPGFERFLLGKTIAQLKRSAYSGPVVILNASKGRCDALIVRSDVDDVLHVPLPSITLAQLEILQLALEKALQWPVESSSSLQPEALPPDTTSQADDPDQLLDLLLDDLHLQDEVEAKLSRPLASDAAFKLILSVLWKDIVKPVLVALGFLTPGELRRIFWSPTGPFAFLPIHAAGLYDTTEPGSRLSDFAISSYTPALGALASIRGSDVTSPTRLLVVRQPDTDGARPLPGAHEEIKYRFSHSNLVESNGTVEDVLEKMAESDWVHFACHAIQDLRQPVESGLLLADHRRLKLSDIINLSRPQGGLAFLSACQTAMGDKRLSEEAIHLAAGMLLAGYPSVIATMWHIGDRDAPEVARDVYGELLRGASKMDEVPDSRRSARALHGAVQRLRERGVPFLSWVPFVHIGL